MRHRNMVSFPVRGRTGGCWLVAHVSSAGTLLWDITEHKKWPMTEIAANLNVLHFLLKFIKRWTSAWVNRRDFIQLIYFWTEM